MHISSKTRRKASNFDLLFSENSANNLRFSHIDSVKNGKMNTESALTRLFRILHHRSLTLSVVTIFFAFLASGFLPESDYRLQQEGPEYLLPAYIVAVLAFAVCCITFVNLLKDDRRGYESFRLSVATLLLSFACVPISLLFVMVMSQVVRAYWE